MTPDELEALIEGQTETAWLEFKGACEWDVDLFAKDILALSNVRDGGYVIVGVNDSSYVREPISVDQLKTFDPEKMRDQMTKFADPHVDFTVATPVDKNGLQFVVIRVLPFEEIPVLCRIDRMKAQVNAGTLYYRSQSRRPESARVSNSYDMRTIIETATVRTWRKKRSLGFKVESAVKEALDDELEGL